MHTSFDPAAACLRDAQRRMPALIAAVMDRGIRYLAFHAVLSPEASRSQLKRVAGAMLFKMRGPIERAFLEAMNDALSDEYGYVASEVSTGLDVCLDDGLAERFELAHLCDAAELACQSECVEFEALFCGASGRHVVQGGNPLRVEYPARCLGAALAQWPVRPSTRAAWFNHLGEPLGLELAQLYRTLSRELRGAGVREAQFIPPMVGGRPFQSWGAAA
jgi:hypothetical protein